jgi:hypothetical protein
MLACSTCCPPPVGVRTSDRVYINLHPSGMHGWSATTWSASRNARRVRIDFKDMAIQHTAEHDTDAEYNNMHGTTTSKWTEHYDGNHTCCQWDRSSCGRGPGQVKGHRTDAGAMPK